MADDPPPVTVIAPPRRGRPRAPEPRSVVTTWLPISQYDALIREARRRELSVSALVRERLRQRVTRPR